MQPTTELDARFSEPGATATAWDETERVLAAAQLGWISTVRSDGRPHVTPLVPVWFDDAVHFTTGPGEQKAKNLESNPNVVLTLSTDTWDRGLDVVVEGVARRITDETTLRRLAEQWAARWDGRWRFGVEDGAFSYPGGASLVFRVDATKILAFGRGTFSHTRHRLAH